MKMIKSFMVLLCLTLSVSAFANLQAYCPLPDNKECIYQTMKKTQLEAFYGTGKACVDIHVTSQYIIEGCCNYSKAGDKFRCYTRDCEVDHTGTRWCKAYSIFKF